MHGIPDDVKARRWEKDGIHFTPFGSDEARHPSRLPGAMSLRRHHV